MNTIKYLILILSFSISSYIGFIKAKEFSDRVEQLKKFESALTMFKAKIEFTYEPVKEIFTQISSAVYKDENNIFKLTKDNLGYRDIGLVWEDQVNNYNSYLNKEDKEIIKMFGKLLGKTDKNGQISEIELSRKFIEKQIEKAEDEKQKNVKLYRSLGVIIGFVIIIIFI